MSEGLVTMAYIGASVLFILSLGGLSHQETARRGNIYGIIGMTIAILATVLSDNVTSYGLLVPAMIIGAVVGAFVASRVLMTQMPQLVAALHSFVGLAAVLVGIATFLDPTTQYQGAEKVIHEIEIYLGVFIGAITFTGSVVAFGKLHGVMTSKPLLLPARHWLNLGALVLCLLLGYVFLATESTGLAVFMLIVMAVIAFAIGAHLILAIGGADMPVVVSMLNSYSGWAAAAAGFMLDNDLLIVTGALVGSSGAILSYIMCRAMNRKFISVILGGFGSTGGAGPAADEEAGEVIPISAEETAYMLLDANEVVIVPGYGMAVAQAQNTVSEITRILRAKGVEVRFGIHPVAGRLPGHMNVLLAEANVPYDLVVEMDDINRDFPTTDVAFVIGANDITNPAARTDASSPIYGMPVLEVDKSRMVMFVKRSMATGYAGVDNPLFTNENTMMLFGDAKQMCEDIIKALR